MLKTGILIPLLLMIPNAVWLLLPGRQSAGDSSPAPLPLTLAENLGRVTILALPLFYNLNLDQKYSRFILPGMILCLSIYYFCWLRYFIAGPSVELLSAPLLGIPLPMAVMPVIFLVLSSYLMTSFWMLGAALFFGTIHILVSAISL